MAGPKRVRGFTLVELLVVITIIGMLMALLLPAIQAAREAGRRNTCANNMRNCTIALNTIESAKKKYPGYANPLNGKRASWAVMILPQLEHSDLYRLWTQSPALTSAPSGNIDGPTITSGGIAQPWPYAFAPVAVFNCPSRPTTPLTPDNTLAFVVNTGSVGTGTAFDNLPGSSGLSHPWPPNASSTSPPEDANSGVFFNHFGGDVTGSNFTNMNTTGRYNPTPGTSGPKIGIDFISTNDGSTYTLMMTENLNASSWAGDPTAGGQPMGTDFQMRQQTGFVWYISNAGSGTPPLVANNQGGVQGTNGNQPIGINSAVGQPSSGIIQPPTSSGNGDGLLYSYPSSQHPGGVNMTFCDAHLQFVADDIPYHVFTQLMTPAYRLVQVPDGNGQTESINAYNKANASSPSLLWTYLLKETDF